MEIYAVNVKEKIKPHLSTMLQKYLSVEEQEKINRYRRWQDAQRSLVGRILIRSLICKEFSIKYDQVAFTVNKFGKPALKHQNDCHFNISHSGQWVVGALDHGLIGIDIEEITEIDLKIADRFFSPEECCQLKKLPLEYRSSFFFDLWTLKESYIKAVGKGLSLPLNSFTILNKPGAIEIIGAAHKFFFRQYDGFEGYKLSVCAVNDAFPPKVKILDVDQFISFSLKSLAPLA